jgi:hypothetical protein
MLRKKEPSLLFLLTRDCESFDLQFAFHGKLWFHFGGFAFSTHLRRIWTENTTTTNDISCPRGSHLLPGSQRRIGTVAGLIRSVGIFHSASIKRTGTGFLRLSFQSEVMDISGRALLIICTALYSRRSFQSWYNLKTSRKKQRGYCSYLSH